MVDLRGDRGDTAGENTNLHALANFEILSYFASKNVFSYKSMGTKHPESIFRLILGLSNAI